MLSPSVGIQGGQRSTSSSELMLAASPHLNLAEPIID
jgi:hypothetical protein